MFDFSRLSEHSGISHAKITVTILQWCHKEFAITNQHFFTSLFVLPLETTTAQA